MKKNDLVTSALADANALKESAIEYAKLELMEKFMPKLDEILEHTMTEEQNAEKTMDDGEDGTPAGSNVGDTSKETAVASKKKLEAKKSKKEQEEMDDEEEEELTEQEEDEMDDDDDVNENFELSKILEELEADEEELEEQEEKDDDEEITEQDEDEEEELTESEIRSLLNQLRIEQEEKDDDEEITEEDEYESDDEKTESLMAQNRVLRRDLNNAYEAIKVMKEHINEVSLMNSKLLYYSKLFDKYQESLTKKEKMTILEIFDRAKCLREVKLVYSTIELNMQKFAKPTKPVTESFNSDVISGKTDTNKKTIVNEGNEVIERLQLLANIQK